MSAAKVQSSQPSITIYSLYILKLQLTGWHLHLVIKRHKVDAENDADDSLQCDYFDPASKTQLLCQQTSTAVRWQRHLCEGAEIWYSALDMNELNSPWILQPSVCLCSESADHIFPVIRVAFWKPGLQNERDGPRDLCVSICLHSGCYCCWQVRWPLCVILYNKILPLPGILLFYSNSELNAAQEFQAKGLCKAYFSSESHYSSVKTKSVFY